MRLARQHGWKRWIVAITVSTRRQLQCGLCLVVAQSDVYKDAYQGEVHANTLVSAHVVAKQATVGAEPLHIQASLGMDIASPHALAASSISQCCLSFNTQTL